MKEKFGLGHAENLKEEEKIELSPPSSPPQMIQKHLIGKAFENFVA